MPTWHQQRSPVPQWHQTKWTVVEGDTPGRLLTLSRFDTQTEANIYWNKIGKPAGSRIVPPVEHHLALRMARHNRDGI